MSKHAKPQLLCFSHMVSSTDSVQGLQYFLQRAETSTVATFLRTISAHITTFPITLFSCHVPLYLFDRNSIQERFHSRSSKALSSITSRTSGSSSIVAHLSAAAISRSFKFQTSPLSDQPILTCKFHQHSHSSWCEEIYQQCLSPLTKICESHILVHFSPISLFPLRHARHYFFLQPETSYSGCVKLSIDIKQQFRSIQYMRLMSFKCTSVLRSFVWNGYK